MKEIVIIIYMLLLYSCGYNTEKDKQELERLMSRNIILPINMDIMVNGRDTIITNHFDSKYKMIIYTDYTSCSSCTLSKLFLWDDLINWSYMYNGELKYYFIFNPSSDEKIHISLKNSLLDYPMLLDTLGEFERLNPHLPKNKAMHTFLLDENNNVVLVGSPLYNPKIEKMFKDIIQEKLGKKE